MISFDLFKRIMSFETEGRYCIEILFVVGDSQKYNLCWMGKLPHRETKADVYWYGLTPDGNNAFDYPKFDEFVSAKVFDGQSLSDIWDEITIKEINGCAPEDMIPSYLSDSGEQGAPQPVK